MKTKTLLIAAVMFLGLSAAAFAQATFSVGSIPVTAVINTGLTEKSGDVTFTQISGISVDGTITISYGVPITNDFTTVEVNAPAGSGYASGVANGVVFVSTVTVNDTASDNASGILVLNVPGGVSLVNSSFTVSGVRVAVAGTTLTSLSGSISTTHNAITAGQTNVVVISSISPGIASIKSDPAGALNATTGTVTKQPIITVKEGFLDAWGDPAQNTEAGLKITLSAAPPAGLSIQFPATGTTDGGGIFQASDSKGVLGGAPSPITSSSTSLVVYYRVATATDPTKVETLTLNVTLSVASDADLPLPTSSVTYVVSLAPIGTAFDSKGNVDPTQPIPRYVQSDVGPATLFTITGTTTTLLVPFAQTVTSAGYNTGFAISNTTSDPGTPTGFASPVAQSGTITFYFFPQVSGGTAPAAFSYTTAASSPGTGLDASGKLPSGSTYTVLLSQILAAANAPADFTGYCFIVTNFTNAHGQYVLSNFTTFSQGALALVITGDRNGSTPESLNN